jgi:hypothetical protein
MTQHGIGRVTRQNLGGRNTTTETTNSVTIPARAR